MEVAHSQVLLHVSPLGVLALQGLRSAAAGRWGPGLKLGPRLGPDQWRPRPGLGQWELGLGLGSRLGLGRRKPALALGLRSMGRPPPSAALLLQPAARQVPVLAGRRGLSRLAVGVWNGGYRLPLAQQWHLVFPSPGTPRTPPPWRPLPRRRQAPRPPHFRHPSSGAHPAGPRDPCHLALPPASVAEVAGADRSTGDAQIPGWVPPCRTVPGRR